MSAGPLSLRKRKTPRQTTIVRDLVRTHDQLADGRTHMPCDELLPICKEPAKRSKRSAISLLVVPEVVKLGSPLCSLELHHVFRVNFTCSTCLLLRSPPSFMPTFQSATWQGTKPHAWNPHDGDSQGRCATWTKPQTWQGHTRARQHAGQDHTQEGNTRDKATRAAQTQQSLTLAQPYAARDTRDAKPHLAPHSSHQAAARQKWQTRNSRTNGPRYEVAGYHRTCENTTGEQESNCEESKLCFFFPNSIANRRSSASTN